MTRRLLDLQSRLLTARFGGGFVWTGGYFSDVCAFVECPRAPPDSERGQATMGELEPTSPPSRHAIRRGFSLAL